MHPATIKPRKDLGFITAVGTEVLGALRYLNTLPGIEGVFQDTDMLDNALTEGAAVLTTPEATEAALREASVAIREGLLRYTQTTLSVKHMGVFYRAPDDETPELKERRTHAFATVNTVVMALNGVDISNVDMDDAAAQHAPKKKDA